ncbi:hypothetical protein D9M71_842430 [compost metagenome]
MLRAEVNVGGVLTMIGRINAHHHLRLRMTTQKRCQIVASLLFERLLNGVFKIDNHPVRAISQRL